MSSAKSSGIKIPEELAFVLYGDHSLVEFFEPSLTVINQFPISMGETSLNILLDILLDILNSEKEISAKTHVLEGKLIIRNSSLRKSTI